MNPPPERPTPAAAVFGETAAARFAALRAGIAAAGSDPSVRDAFVLVREVAELLRELHGEPGDPDSLPALIAFLQHAYLFWDGGAAVQRVSEAQLARALAAGASAPAPLAPPLPPGTAVSYVQLPALRVWGSPLPGAAAEPLDGWFAAPRGSELGVLAVFGLTGARAGFTAVEVQGPRPAGLARADGAPLFAPTLPGGAAAGLASLAGEEELLELAWRIREPA